LTAGIIFGLAIPYACQSAVAAEPKRVMLLHSFGRDFKPWSEYARSVRTELERQSPWPLEITDHSLLTSRSSDEDPEIPFIHYLSALFAKRPLDLIVCIGAPAAAFVQRHREQLFPTTPMVFTAGEQRRVQYSKMTDNDAVVAVRINYLAAIENILRVLPDTNNVTVVVGTSPIEKFWKEAIANDVEPLANRITFSWTDHLSFEELLKSATALPRRSAIFWELMIVDAAGVVHEGSNQLTKLHAVASAPIFSYDESFFLGREIVGGPLLLISDTSRQTAAVGVRILGGEKAGDIKVPAIEFTTPQFNWREMQRWSIPESRLLPESQIHFRDPTAWEQYHQEIVAVSAALLLQAALITWLFYEIGRRQRAEIKSRSAMIELTHMNRRAAAGQLSASLTHEVIQPLTGMVAGASAALRWLRADKPNVEKAEAALEAIAAAGHRACDIVASVRAMFKKEAPQKVPTDINQTIRTVLSIVRVELQKHGVELQTQLNERLPTVQGDKVQLQQVVLNLVMNGIEAMQSVSPRVLKVQTDQPKAGTVRVSIEDTGVGIDPSDLNQIFKPLFTSKSTGMGMGLSICRSIIESHGGRIWASAAVNRGSIFQFELPINSA
jgi:signal transduction histidine kinase